MIQQESERLKFVCKLKNKSNGTDEKISRIFDSYSNLNNMDNSEKGTENIEKNARFYSADVSNNMDKWGQDIPFEILSFDVKFIFFIPKLILTIERKNRNCFTKQ